MTRHCCLIALAALLCAAADAQPAADQSQEPMLAALKSRLDYGLWGDRMHALYALGDLGRQALPLLSYATEDADWQVRLTAVYFLGKAGPEATPALAGLAREEPCPFVRISALKWLSGLGEEGRARYSALVTFEDRDLLAALPDRFGTQQMGRALSIDTPDDKMTSDFFNGGIDLRVLRKSGPPTSLAGSGFRHVCSHARSGGTAGGRAKPRRDPGRRAAPGRPSCAGAPGARAPRHRKPRAETPQRRARRAARPCRPG